MTPQNIGFLARQKLLLDVRTHQRTVVWLLKWTPDHEPRTYMARGWPFFEQAVASLITDAVNLIEIGPVAAASNNWSYFLHGHFRAVRAPPIHPKSFEDQLKLAHDDMKKITSEKLSAAQEAQLQQARHWACKGAKRKCELGC